MHNPRQSLGESSTQPSTPCSASNACGGKRSARPASCAETFRRRAFFKSGAAPALSATESIMCPQQTQSAPSAQIYLLHNLLTGACEQLEAESIAGVGSPHHPLHPLLGSLPGARRDASHPLPTRRRSTLLVRMVSKYLQTRAALSYLYHCAKNLRSAFRRARRRVRPVRPGGAYPRRAAFGRLIRQAWRHGAGRCATANGSWLAYLLEESRRLWRANHHQMATPARGHRRRYSVAHS